MPATQPAIVYHGSDRDFATELAALAAPGSWQWHSPSNESPSASPAAMQLRIVDLDDLSDGIEITQRLKHDSPGVPVIVVSRDAAPDLAAQAQRSGAEAFFLKPLLDVDLFAASVAAAFAKLERWQRTQQHATSALPPAVPAERF